MAGDGECPHLGRIDADFFTVATQGFIFNDSIHFGKKSEIFSHSNIFPRMDLGASLPYQDASGGDNLSPEDLYASPLPLRIPTVPTGSACFFVCHFCYLFGC